MERLRQNGRRLAGGNLRCHRDVLEEGSELHDGPPDHHDLRPEPHPQSRNGAMSSPTCVQQACWGIASASRSVAQRNGLITECRVCSPGSIEHIEVDGGTHKFLQTKRARSWCENVDVIDVVPIERAYVRLRVRLGGHGLQAAALQIFPNEPRLPGTVFPPASRSRGGYPGRGRQSDGTTARQMMHPTYGRPYSVAG